MFDDIIKNNKKWYMEWDIKPISFDENDELKEFKMPIEEDDTPVPVSEFDEEIEMDWGKLGENPFADARYAMAEYFNMDEDLRHSYECNIAMFLYDNCNIKNKEKRDQLARDLMKLIWG